jgi:hypothetical protein
MIRSVQTQIEANRHPEKPRYQPTGGPFGFRANIKKRQTNPNPKINASARASGRAAKGRTDAFE